MSTVTVGVQELLRLAGCDLSAYAAHSRGPP